MNENEILNLKKCVVNDTKKEAINVSVYLVYRGCFNDERLIEELKLNIDDIKDKELFWFDIYLGKMDGNKTRLAVAHIDGLNVYFLKDDGEKVQVVKNDRSIFAVADYDESYLISTHIW